MEYVKFAFAIGFAIWGIGIIMYILSEMDMFWSTLFDEVAIKIILVGTVILIISIIIIFVYSVLVGIEALEGIRV